MPVIDPARLQKQIQQCFVRQSNAKHFVNAILELLEIYSDHAYRPGELAALPSALKSFHVPQPLIRTLKRELVSICQNQPHQALSIAIELWNQPFQECKDLAISILKNVPLDSEHEIFQITENWASTCTHIELIASIAEQALSPDRFQHPASLIHQAQKWTLDERMNIRKLGFLVLEQISVSISFGDLPLLFKVISPYLNRCPPQSFEAVVSICNHLIKKSPKEMAYLMRTAILDNPIADAKKLIKACLRSFPTELQSDLQTIDKR